MDRLILMRHGQAERHAAQGGDFERALTERGREDAALIGRLLAARGVAPDLVLSSSARRTRETTAAVGQAFAGARVEQTRDLYHAEPEEVMAVVEAESGEAATVLVVAHNPGLHELALRLAINAGAPSADFNRIRGRFPTATTVVFAFEGDRPVLEHLLYVSEHGGIGAE